ncbi:MAG: hypothetical protein FWG03_09035, partial [Clostridiales bacterium]|nr:hypothetical protein [Clostridiales bacterium]
MKKPIFTLTLALLILLSACVTDPIDTEQLPSGPLESEEVQIVSETPAPDGTQDPAQDEDTGIEKFINDQLTIIK